MSQFAPQRMLTHARENQELKLASDNKTYIDVNTGWKYPATVIEFVRSVSVAGTPIQVKYGRPYINKAGQQAYYLKDLPRHIVINSVEADDLNVYPATSYNDYHNGCMLSDVKDSGLKRNASPYYGNMDITILSYR